MFVILQLTDTLSFKTNLLFLYCCCVSVLTVTFLMLLYEQYIEAEILVKACFWLKDKVCILLVSEIHVLVFCYNVANLENNMLLMLIIV